MSQARLEEDGDEGGLSCFPVRALVWVSPLSCEATASRHHIGRIIGTPDTDRTRLAIGRYDVIVDHGWHSFAFIASFTDLRPIEAGPRGYLWCTVCEECRRLHGSVSEAGLQKWLVG